MESGILYVVTMVNVYLAFPFLRVHILQLFKLKGIATLNVEYPHFCETS